MAKRYRRPVNTLAPYIGEVTIAANDVQFSLLYIFQDLLNNRTLAHSLFFSAPSDAAQQKMVLDAIEVVLKPIEATIAARISKRIRGLDKLRVRRNDIIHAVWTTEPMSMKLTPLQPKSSLRSKADLKAAMRELANELMLEASELFLERSRMFELQHFKVQAMSNAPLYKNDIFT